MTSQPFTSVVPEFTLGDRLRKARSLTGLTTRQFVERIGVSHGTITNAEGEKVEIRRITLQAWAMATGVPVEWLVSGSTTTSPTPTSDGGVGVPNDALAKLTAGEAAPFCRWRRLRRAYPPVPGRGLMHIRVGMYLRGVFARLVGECGDHHHSNHHRGRP